MGIGAAILGGSAISGLASAFGSNAQADAIQDATRLQEKIYKQTTRRMQPYTDAGGAAINPYLYEIGLAERPEGYGGIEMSPATNFLLEQGRGTIEAGAAGRGKLWSGASGQALEGYRHNLALSDRDNQLNRFLGLMQMGQASAANQGQVGQNYANAASNLLTQGGNARAAGYMGVANAANDAIGNYAGYQNYNRLLDTFGAAA